MADYDGNQDDGLSVFASCISPCLSEPDAQHGAVDAQHDAPPIRALESRGGPLWS